MPTTLSDLVDLQLECMPESPCSVGLAPSLKGTWKNRFQSILHVGFDSVLLQRFEVAG